MENGGKIGSHDDLRGDGTLTSLLEIGASSVCKLLTMETPSPGRGCNSNSEETISMWQPGYSAKASLSFWLLVLTCATASAVDLGASPPPSPVPWVQPSWTGFYPERGRRPQFSQQHDQRSAWP